MRATCLRSGSMRSVLDDIRRGVAVAALLLATVAAAGAQGLPKLTVSALGMHADVSRAAVGQLFHITIHAHVAQPGVGLEELVVLPEYTNLTPLGDVRATTSGPGGTDYTETLSVSGVHPGTAEISPVTIDAIDAKTGKSERFSSNALSIEIVDGTLGQNPVSWIAGVAATVVRWLVGVLGILAAIFVLFALLRRRRGRTLPPPRYVAPPPPPPPPARVVETPQTRLRVSIDRLRREPTRANAVAVRAELFALAGASETETLGSILARLNGDNPALRAALRSAERAAFIEDRYIIGAINDLIPAAERIAQS